MLFLSIVLSFTRCTQISASLQQHAPWSVVQKILHSWIFNYRTRTKNTMSCGVLQVWDLQPEQRDNLPTSWDAKNPDAGAPAGLTGDAAWQQLAMKGS